MSDLVSVVIPVYKVEEYILNILKSVNKQTYQNLEIVVVDDGTPDKSAEIAEEFLKTTALCWKIIHKQNAGLAAARNTGIDNASGDWVICPDSDDFIEPKTIETMLDYALNNNLDCVFCGYKSVHLSNIAECFDKNMPKKVYQADELRELFLYRKLILLTPGMLLKRTVYNQVKYNPQCPYDEDINFLWQLLFILPQYGYVSNPFYHYLSRETSMVHTLSPKNYLQASAVYAETVKKLLNDYPEQIKLISKIYPKYRLGGSHVLAKANDYKTFRQTVIADGYRKDMLKLIFQSDLKLSVYALIYCLSLRMFYRISR